MDDDVETREEWSASVCSLVAGELLHGMQRGMVTAEEAQQLTARFLVLMDQTLDLRASRTAIHLLNPWSCVDLRPLETH